MHPMRDCRPQRFLQSSSFKRETVKVKPPLGCWYVALSLSFWLSGRPCMWVCFYVRSVFISHGYCSKNITMPLWWWWVCPAGCSITSQSKVSVMHLDCFWDLSQIWGSQKVRGLLTYQCLDNSLTFTLISQWTDYISLSNTAERFIWRLCPHPLWRKAATWEAKKRRKEKMRRRKVGWSTVGYMFDSV